ELAEAHPRDEPRAPQVRELRLFYAEHAPIEHVGDDPAPELGFGPAADDPELAHRSSEKSLDLFEQPARVQRNALENGADHVRALVRKRVVEERGTEVRIFHRRALA